MSKNGPCTMSAHRGEPVPAVAWWRIRDSTLVQLCQSCLDCWFDNADDDPDLEPTAWGWLVAPIPPTTDIATWATDPRNHTAVANVLRTEARVNPEWLREFLLRDERIHRRVLV